MHSDSASLGWVVKGREEALCICTKKYCRVRLCTIPSANQIDMNASYWFHQPDQRCMQGFSVADDQPPQIAGLQTILCNQELTWRQSDGASDNLPQVVHSADVNHCLDTDDTIETFTPVLNFDVIFLHMPQVDSQYLPHLPVDKTLEFQKKIFAHGPSFTPPKQ